MKNEVLPAICLKENGTIVIPSPPEALTNCGVTSGDVKDHDFNEVGKTASVRIWFNYPLTPSSRTSKLFQVTDIKACSNARTQSSNARTHSLTIGLAVGSTLLFLPLFALLFVFCWKKKGKGKSKDINKEVDANPVYGIYALNDEGEDVGVTEVRDTNDYYVM